MWWRIGRGRSAETKGNDGGVVVREAVAVLGVIRRRISGIRCQKRAGGEGEGQVGIIRERGNRQVGVCGIRAPPTLGLLG
jgi:hypothetical protein